MICSTGTTVPRLLDKCVTATILVRLVTWATHSSSKSSPRSFIGMTLSTAPVCWQIICQGTMLLWCSRAETCTSSPGRRNARPKLAATRLMPSVVPRVKMISAGSAALMKRATVRRAFS